MNDFLGTNKLGCNIIEINYEVIFIKFWKMRWLSILILKRGK